MIKSKVAGDFWLIFSIILYKFKNNFFFKLKIDHEENVL